MVTAHTNLCTVPARCLASSVLAVQDRMSAAFRLVAVLANFRSSAAGVQAHWFFFQPSGTKPAALCAAQRSMRSTKAPLSKQKVLLKQQIDLYCSTMTERFELQVNRGK